MYIVTTIFYTALVLMIIFMLYFVQSLINLVPLKAEVIGWERKIKKPDWEYDDPMRVQPLDISIFVKTKIGKRTLHIIWERDELCHIPACVGYGYKMEVMVPLLGRHVRGMWWIDEKDVRRV